MAQFNIRVKVDPKQAQAGSKQVERSLGGVENRANRLKSVLIKTFAVIGITAGLAGGVKTLADFGQTMSTVGAISQATASDFVRLKDTAKQLGATTRFSASQAGEGLLFLARAGFNVNQSIETVDDTLRLAQAGALDLGSAADIATNVLTGFRLKTDQAGRVVDVLALAANSANTDVRQLGDAMKFVAPVAAGVGVDLEVAAAAAGALSNAGLQAGLAGTGLRRVLSELESPSSNTIKQLKKLGLETNQYRVSSVGLIAALDALNKAGVDTGLGLELFGDRGGPAFEVLSSSIPDIIKLKERLDGAGGTAKRIADIMDNNLNGALLAVKSAFEALILSFGDFGADNALTVGARAIASALRDAAKNIDKTVESLAALAGLIATIKFFPLIQGAGEAAVQFIRLTSAVAAGNAVLLGTAEAAAAKQAASTLAAAEAEVALTATVLENATAEQTKIAALIAATEAQLVNQRATIGNAEATHALSIELTALQVKYAQLTVETEAAAASNTGAAAAVQGAVASSTAANTAVARQASGLGLLTKAFGIVTGAVKRFTVALLTNPFGVIAVAIAAIIAFFVLFADKIKLTSKGFATLQDVVDVTFEKIGSALRVAVDFWKKTLGELFDSLKLGIDFTNLSLADWIRVIAATMDDIIGIIAGAIGVIIFGAQKLPKALGDIFLTAFNGIISVIEKSINKIIEGLNKIPKINIEPIDIGAVENKFKGGAQELGTTVKDVFLASFNTTTVEDAVNGIFKEAEKRARDRKFGPLPDFVEPLPEDIALALPPAPEVNRKKDSPGTPGFQKALDDLKQEAELLKLSSREYQFRSELLDIQKDIKGKLTKVEEMALEQQLKLNIELRAQVQVMDELTKPHDDLITREEALLNLYYKGAISLKTYNEELRKAKERFNELTGVDPSFLDTFQKKLKDVPTTTEILISGFDRASASIADFVTTGEADFSDFARSILRDVTQILLNKAILALINAFGGGGGAVPFLGPNLSGSFGFAHGGSFIVGGSGGTDSQLVNFKATPKERVTVETPAQQKKNSSPDVNLKVVATFDPEIALDAMASSQGERVVFAHLERNAPKLKKLLGG